MARQPQPPPGRLGRPGDRDEARGDPAAPHGRASSGIAGSQPRQRDQRGPGESRRLRREAEPRRPRHAAFGSRQGRADPRLRGRGVRRRGIGPSTSGVSEHDRAGHRPAAPGPVRRRCGSRPCCWPATARPTGSGRAATNHPRVDLQAPRGGPVAPGPGVREVEGRVVRPPGAAGRPGSARTPPRTRCACCRNPPPCCPRAPTDAHATGRSGRPARTGRCSRRGACASTRTSWTLRHPASTVGPLGMTRTAARRGASP